MFNKRSETEEFQVWLQSRVEEADLSPSEIAEFLRWLMSHSCDQSKKKHNDSTVSFSDVLQIVKWMTGRMQQLFVEENEQREFSAWLKERLEAHSCLSADEMKSVLESLKDK